MKQLEPAADTVADRMGSAELAKRRRNESRLRGADGHDSTDQSLQDFERLDQVPGAQDQIRKGDLLVLHDDVLMNFYSMT